MSDYECLLYEEADGIATVTLNRPDKHNSFSPTQIAEIEDVWKKLRFNDDVACVIVTGAGERAFSSGIDLTHAHPQPVSKMIIDDPMLRIGPKTNDMWKPVIAAVNGMACGGAFYILGEVEFIIASENATFFDPHVTHGMPCIYEPILMLQRMPIGEIMRLSLLGRHERMSAKRAYEIGLVSEVVPFDGLMEAARWSAEVIASAPRSVGSSGCGSAGLLLPTVIAHEAIMIASANRNTARAIVLTMTTTPEFNGRIAEARRWRNTSLIFG